MVNIASLLENINDFEKLGENWDSHGAKRFDRIVLDEAKRCVSYLNENIGFVPEAVVPMSSGGVQLEFHSKHKDIEIVVGEAGRNYSVLFGETDERDNLTLEKLGEEIRSYLRKILI